jgi:hypothetical protein
MSPETQKQIWAEIRAVGDRLVGHLPPSPRHPKGRNPYAHVALCIKQKFGCSYKDIPDETVPKLRAYLRKLEDREGTTKTATGR